MLHPQAQNRVGRRAAASTGSRVVGTIAMGFGGGQGGAALFERA